MLREFAKLSWDQIQDSEYVFKSNVQKHVVHMAGKELGDDKDSTVLTYYNFYTGMPMIIVYRIEGIYEGGVEDIEGFRAVKEFRKDDDGNYTETTYIENVMHEALS